MIRTVHLPVVYADIPADEMSARLYCGTLVSVLHDAAENCVLLVDGSHMKQAMYAAVKNWPGHTSTTHRLQARAALTALVTRNRFVTIGNSDPALTTCGRPGCGHALGIVAAEKPDACVYRHGCQECALCKVSAPWSTSVDNYPSSNLDRECRRWLERHLADGEWDKPRFESEIWDRVFRYATNVRVFDRYIGRHIVGKGEYGHQPLFVSAAYKRTLKWMVSSYANYAKTGVEQRFEVLCGIDWDKVSPARAREAALALKAFAQDLEAQFNVSISVQVKREMHNAQTPHDRFLLTDQYALSIGRGADLLRDDGRVRDTSVHTLDHDDMSRVWARTEKLPEV